MPIKKLILKILVIGERATGKTSYIYKITRDQFSSTYRHSIGEDFFSKIINISDEEIMAQMWEIPDFKTFFKESKSLLRGAVGCIFLSDSTNIQAREETLEYKKILDEYIKFSDNGKIPCILVESKRDLINEENEMEKVEKDVKSFALSNGFDGSFLVSSKTGENLNESLEFIVNNIRKRQKVVEEKEEKELKREIEGGEKKDKISIRSDTDKESDNESKIDPDEVYFDSSGDDILKVSASVYLF